MPQTTMRPVGDQAGEETVSATTPQSAVNIAVPTFTPNPRPQARPEPHPQPQSPQQSLPRPQSQLPQPLWDQQQGRKDQGIDDRDRDDADRKAAEVVIKAGPENIAKSRNDEIEAARHHQHRPLQAARAGANDQIHIGAGGDTTHQADGYRRIRAPVIV